VEAVTASGIFSQERFSLYSVEIREKICLSDAEVSLKQG